MYFECRFPPISLGHVHDHFKNEEVGTVHYMSGTASAEAAYQFFDDENVERHRRVSGDARLGESAAQGVLLAAKIAGSHDDMRPNQFSISL